LALVVCATDCVTKIYLLAGIAKLIGISIWYGAVVTAETVCAAA